MKQSILAAALTVVALGGSPAIAQPQAPAGKTAEAQQKTPDVVEFDKQASVIQERIKKMQEQMEAIHQTQDQKERQKLLREHWETMQNGMGLMQGMWGSKRGPMARGDHMMGWRGGMGHYYSRLTPEQLKQRQYMTDQYMSMQQQMMNQMMQHQNYMWTRPQSPGK